MRSTYVAVRQQCADSTNADYVNEIQKLIGHVNPQGQSAQLWQEFLCDPNKHPENVVIESMSGNSDITSPTQHQEVVARALMLLRLATGACKLLLSNSRPQEHRIRFWWH